MDNYKNNPSDKKRILIFTDCRKLVENAQEIIQCPVCLENSDQMEQCKSGHLICFTCKAKLVSNSCPLCKNSYLGTKSFIMPELTKALNSLKISFDVLETKVNNNNNIEVYRTLIKTILTNMSVFLKNTSSTFQMVSSYLQSPDCTAQKEMERQLISLTSQLHNVQYFMEKTKDRLTSLKK